MRAVIQDRYGSADVVVVGELPDPVPADDEVLIAVRATSLNGSDRENLVGKPFYARVGGLRRPRNPVPGSDVAGTVVAVGRSVTEYTPGDEVFGELAGYRGGLARYVATSPRLLARKPEHLSFVRAAAVPQAGCIALRATRGLGPGDKLLVNGAGGAGGALVIGLARHLGAHVTAVDRADKAGYLLRVGADDTVAFEHCDWADQHDRYDRVVDLVAHRSPFRVHQALRAGGSYLMVGGRTRVLLATFVAGPLLRLLTGKRVRVLLAPQSRADLEEVTALVTDGVLVPAIDEVRPLEEAPAAFARLEAGDNLGKIVVEVS